MKPIEPGCLAITIGAINESNIGKEVTVIRKGEGNRWWVEGDVVSALGHGVGWAREEWLLRIDGHEDESISSEQELTA